MSSVVNGFERSSAQQRLHGTAAFRGPCRADDFQPIVLTPAGYPDPSLAVAATRANAVGIVNMETGCDLDALEGALDRVARLGGGPFGVKLPGYADQKFLEAALVRSSAGLTWVVTDLEGISAWRGPLDEFRAEGGYVLCEILAWDRACEESEALIDGWIAKGHECGGLVGESSSFVLLQKLASCCCRPVYVRGGITENTAAACWVGGAAGVVIDDQALLLDDSPLPAALRQRLANVSGTDSLQIESPNGQRYLRVLATAGRSGVEQLQRAVAEEGDITDDIVSRLSWTQAFVAPAGQAAVFARRWAEDYRSLGRALQAVRRAVRELPIQAFEQRALSKNAPLAGDNGTRWPIVQGPMSRVSDRPAFLRSVADAGGLPMVALSLMRGKQLQDLLRETRDLLGDAPWGVGLLGFTDGDIRSEQLRAIADYRPPFALIAGGRVNQALGLEEKGIPTYVHVPTATLLVQFLEQGVRRFVVEGRECGGHVGPLTSFVLWSEAVDILKNHPLVRRHGQSIHLLLAGGIHDGRSAAIAATLAAPLVARGVRLGVLMGTGYLFTREATECGAVVEEYQRTALDCRETVCLWEGPGYANRCAVTRIAETFRAKKRELEAGGSGVLAVRREMEAFSLGRLRTATKGMARIGAAKSLEPVSAEEQRSDGMYMMGDVATLNDRIRTIAEFHENVGSGALQNLEAAVGREKSRAKRSPPPPKPADIAIVGVGCLLPKAGSPKEYWRNILNGQDCITEVPSDRWDVDAYFSADPEARDKIYSKRGGFLDDLRFDPLRYGIPPASLSAIDPMQLLALELIRQTMENAGYPMGANEAWERTSVIFGFSGGLSEHGANYVARSELTRLLGNADESILSNLPEWTEDSFAGLLPNVTAGRAANRFNFGGTNLTVDAACASSLASIYQAVQELESGRSDVAIAGGVDTCQAPFDYLCFSKTRALSPRGQCRTFDAYADGIVISEGLAAVVLKRLECAERDGDRIYALIKGIGASSDGRAKGVTAPLPMGQRRALRRAYDQAGYEPSTVDLFEAHGTGTVAGDHAELETVVGSLRDAGAGPRNSAIGSVKNLIGHTKATAGIAGLIKAALGLHHRVLPPHHGVKKPNSVLSEPDCPVYLSQAARPWLRHGKYPRRAGVSAFGFGGTNFHVTLEEYDREYRTWRRGASAAEWPCELFVWRAADRSELVRTLEAAAAELHGEECDLAGLSLRVIGSPGEGRAVLALVAATKDELHALLSAAIASLRTPESDPPKSVFFSESPLLGAHKLAVLFPGQGAQYPDMLREMALLFPELADALDEANALLASTPTFREATCAPLSRYIYPGDHFTPEARRQAMQDLTRTEITQPALGALEAGLWSLMRRLGLSADMCAGHSYGEFAALHAAGALSRRDFILLSEARGRAIADSADPANLGAMAAVAAPAGQVEAALKSCPGVVLANLNSPRQSVIAGPKIAVDDASDLLMNRGFNVQRVPVSQAFHSPLMNKAQEAFRQVLSQCGLREPDLPVYGNTFAKPHANHPDHIREVMGDHLTNPVDFAGMVESMYDDGARVFLELGPKAILTSRVAEILHGRTHRAVAVDGGGGPRAFLEALAQLVVEGCDLELPALFIGREAASADASLPDRREADARGTDVLVNASYIRPVGEPQRDTRGKIIEISDQHQKNPSNIVVGLGSKSMEHDGKRLRRPPAKSGNVDEAIAAYHQLMREFLEVQERVMLAYLDGEVALPVCETALPGAPDMKELVAPGKPREVPAGEAEASSQSLAPASLNGVNGNGAHVNAANGVGEPGIKANGSAGEAVEAPKDIGSLLLAIVSAKTGYPGDALALDQNLEADLGIDSIKKMEILGTVVKELPVGQAEYVRQSMEAVAELPSLQAIIDFISGADDPPCRSTTKNGHIGNGETLPFDLTGEGKTAQAVLPRFILAAHPEPVDGVKADELEKGLYILTRDGIGVAEQLASRFDREGVEYAFIPGDVLGDDAAIAGWLSENVGADQSVKGLIHLAGIDADKTDFSEIDLRAWRMRMAAGSKNIFRLLRLCATGLMDGGRFISATAMGGNFGRDYPTCARSGANLPGSAGCIGLVKALSLEWPKCRAKAIDLDPDEPPRRLAEHIFCELTLPGGRREAGYPQGTRTIFRTEPASLAPVAEPLQVGSDWVVLATGGARGITAETLRALAPSAPTLVLVGRTPEPVDESGETAGLDRAELRAHFISKAKAAGGALRPVDIERSVSAIVAAREIRANIDALAKLGATVVYECVDVCDEPAVRRMMEALYERYGRIDAVIHGAGIIDDGLLAKKTPESIDHVFDTKVVSTFLLARLIKPESLKFFCLFASVAGRYGNRGQTDYAAANETLNRLAWMLQQRWGEGVKVRAINWGPWSETPTGSGMVTAEVRRQFKARDVGLVEPGAGREFLLKELLWSPHGQVEVVAGDAPWEYFEERHGALGRVGGPMPLGPRFPILQNATIVGNGGGRDSLEWRFDLVNAPFADHHRFDGIPVMPLAAILQLFAEATAALGFAGEVVEFQDVRVFKGLTMENGPLTLRICCTAAEASSKVGLKVVAAENPDRPFYAATALLAKTVPPAAGGNGPPSRPIADAPLCIDEIYERWLSHGPNFQTLTELVSVSDDRVFAQARTTAPGGIYPAAEPAEWLFDPALLDGAIQTMWIWTRTKQGAPALPVGIKSVRRYRGGAGNGPVIVENLFHSDPDNPEIDQTIRLWDSTGSLVYVIEHLEGHASRKLNRLAGGWQGGRPTEYPAERVMA